jgi:type VI secretion system protein ImpM
VPGPEIAAPAAAAAGFFGKIPARGDFVRAGLPRSFTDPWDAWLEQVIAGSRDMLGPRWLPAWMEAPIWHFRLPAGHCGPAPVLGVWMPSVDAAGRHFPFTLARVGALPADPASWLALAEEIGLEALQHDLAPEAIAARLATADDAGPAVAPEEVAFWWTDGSPFVPAVRLACTGLPDSAAFAHMLHAQEPDGADRRPAAAPDEGGRQG